MYLNVDELEKGFAEARFRKLFAEAFGSLAIEWIEWRDLGYGHQPVARIDSMPVLIGLTWPNGAVVATVIAKKRHGEQRAQAVLPEAHVNTSRWDLTRLIFGVHAHNVVAVLNAAKTICDQCDRCHGHGKSEGSDDYGRPNGEWSACWRCHGRGWLADKNLWLKEDEQIERLKRGEIQPQTQTREGDSYPETGKTVTIGGRTFACLGRMPEYDSLAVLKRESDGELLVFESFKVVNLLVRGE